MTAIVRVRRASRAHICSRCQGLIVRGERYEASSLPPDSDLGNTGWLRGTSHVGSYLRGDRPATQAEIDRVGIGCAESAAYREQERRQLAAAGLLREA